MKKNLAYNFLLSVSQVLLPLISIPYISRVLDPEGIGRVSFIDSFTFYFISIAEFGIVVYGMREVARFKDDVVNKNKLVSELLALHIISSSAALVLYGLSVLLLWGEIQDTRLLLFSLSCLLVNFFACEWYFLGMERFKYITLRSLLTRVLGILSIFVLIKAPEDYYIYYGIIAVTAIVNSGCNTYLLFKEVPVSFKAVNWKRHVLYTKVTYFISLTYGITLMLDNVILRIASASEAAVGYYAFAVKIVRTSAILVTDSLLVFFPRIVTLLKAGDSKKMQQVLLRNLRFLLFLSVPLCTGIFLLAEPLINVYLGRQFLPSVPDLKILAVLPFLKAYNLFISKQVLIAQDREKLYLNSLLAGGVLFILLAFPLSMYYADTGMCWALIIAECFVLALNYYYAKKVAPSLKIFDTRSFVQAVAGVILFYPVIYLLQQAGLSSLQFLIVSIISCAGLYFLIQLFITRNEVIVLVKDVISRYWSGK